MRLPGSANGGSVVSQRGFHRIHFSLKTFRETPMIINLAIKKTILFIKLNC
jgi:hypothetical protein